MQPLKIESDQITHFERFRLVWVDNRVKVGPKTVCVDGLGLLALKERPLGPKNPIEKLGPTQATNQTRFKKTTKTYRAWGYSYLGLE